MPFTLPYFPNFFGEFKVLFLKTQESCKMSFDSVGKTFTITEKAFL